VLAVVGNPIPSLDLGGVRINHGFALGEGRRERRSFSSMWIIEHTEGHYETQDVEHGTVYRWCPESVMIECEGCGKKSTHPRSALIGSLITCECGKDHTARVREELVFQVLDEDEDPYPWRNWHPSEGTGIPF
jgi:hypothetical protein